MFEPRNLSGLNDKGSSQESGSLPIAHTFTNSWVFLGTGYLKNWTFENLENTREKELLLKKQQTQQTMQLQKDIAKLQALADVNMLMKK